MKKAYLVNQKQKFFHDEKTFVFDLLNMHFLEIAVFQMCITEYILVSFKRK